MYLAQNKLPSNKTAVKKVKALAEKYILLDLLLFKIVSNPNKEATVLAIPEVCGDKIITLYHSSLFAGHQGQTRINLNYKPLSRLSMNLKVMPRSHNGHKYILCIIDEVTNYLIMVRIEQSRVE